VVKAAIGPESRGVFRRETDLQGEPPTSGGSEGPFQILLGEPAREEHELTKAEERARAAVLPEVYGRDDVGI